MIEQLTGFPDNVLGIVGKGRITRQDYETVVVPAVEKALKSHARMRLYYEIAPDFTGFDPGAMWQDFKVGMEHLTRWERIAVVTDVDWIRHAMQMFAFMMPATVRAVPIAEAAQARAWIVAP
jgi:hypothetical protein